MALFACICGEPALSYFTVRYLVALGGRGERHRLQGRAKHHLPRSRWLALADQVLKARMATARPKVT
jgi:hypothetical protein